MATDNLVYNSHGEKYEVPRVRVSSINGLQRADHIAFHRHSGAYWHHAIVEDIDIESGEIHVIEYTNTAGEFYNDNCHPPRITDVTIAKVSGGKYKFQDDDVYLYIVKHKRCLDPDEVIRNAKSKLGEGNYHPVNNNCEHFAMLCKTGESFSDQEKKAKEMTVHEVKKAVLTQVAEAASKPGAYECGKEFVTQAASNPTVTWFLKALDVMIENSLNPDEQVIYTELRKLFIEHFAKTSEEKLKEFLIQAALTNWQEVAKGAVLSGPLMTVNGVLTPTPLQALRAGLLTARFNKIENYIFTLTTSIASEQAMKTGVCEIGKDVLTQTASKAGQEVVKTGVQQATKEVVTQATSKAGEEVVKTGVNQATKDTVTQAAVNTGTREATEELVTQAISNAGEEAANTALCEGSEEVLSQTVEKTGTSFVKGAVISAVIEGMSAARDIYWAREDMKKGTISSSEFQAAVVKRITTGTGNVGGSTVGSAIGQVLIPIPFLGAVVGAAAGGVIGKFAGNLLANRWL